MIKNLRKLNFNFFDVTFLPTLTMFFILFIYLFIYLFIF